MIKNLNVKRKDGQTENIYLKVLDLSYMDKILNLQNDIYEGLDDKRLYSPSTREEFETYISDLGVAIGFLTENDELIAMGVFIKNGYNEHNYGYDLELKGDDLLKVGQIESTIVREEYRGNRLQKIICETLEEIGRDKKIEIMTATASPYNEFSVNTFKNLNYEIKKDKIKYGGLRRYVFAKNINK